jgi:large subunit ribosomal protein L28
VWGGHSCLPPLTFIFESLILISQLKAADNYEGPKVKSGGRECPPHTRWQKNAYSDKIAFYTASSDLTWSSFMAHVCDLCGKGPQFGNNISHAHNVTKRRWNVNLRPVHAKVGAATKRIRVCTSCLRSGKVVKA